MVIKCVMESGELLAPGEKKSDETGCKISECKLINGKPSTIVESAVCPAIPTDCPAKFLVPDQTGCCQVCSKPEKLSKIEKYFILFLKTSLLRKLCCHFLVEQTLWAWLSFIYLEMPPVRMLNLS